MKIFQGDVVYIKISESQFKKLVKETKNKPVKVEGSYVVVHGESGNTHRIVVEEPTKNKVELLELGNGLFGLKVNGQAVITHEKHLPEKTLGSGFYFVAQKTEYFPNEERLIKD